MSEPKRKYYVIIEETVSQTFEVEATEAGEAWEIARQKYRDGELVVDNCDVTFTQAMAQNEDGTEATEWEEIYNG